MTPAARLLAVLAAVSLLHAAGVGEVTGVLVDAFGRPAPGHAVVLLDADGKEVARGAAGPSGRYAVENVPRGTYALVVEAPSGVRAVVAAPPLKIRGGRQRLHLRLVEQGDEPASAVATSESWWGSLPTAGKVWVVLGGVGAAAIAVAALDDDEVPASPFQ